jgi:uncharacterized lipoprotein YmbA
VKIHTEMRARQLLAAVFMGLIAAGCAPKQPPPSFYMLSVSAPTMQPGFEQGVRVGLGPVELQAYLNRNQIVSRDTTTKLRVSEQHVWAEPLKEGCTRVLLTSLGLALDSNRIYALPMRQQRPLDYRVPIDVLRFDGTLGAGNEVVLGVRWSVISGNGRDVLVTKVSRIVETIGGDDMQAFVEAQSRAVDRLAVEIASAIKAQ